MCPTSTEGMFMKKIKVMILFLLFGLGCSTLLYALSPSFYAGAFTDYRLDSENQSTGGTIDLGIYGFFSHRAFLTNGGYISSKASATLSGLLSNETLYDFESAQLLVVLPLAKNQLELITAFDSSIIGSDSSGTELKPQWQVLHRFLRGRRTVNPYVAYNGYYLYQSLGTEDRMFHGGTVGFVYSPKVELTYAASAAVGMQQWSNGTRKDLLADTRLQMQALIGYFVTIHTAIDIRYISSSDITLSALYGSVSGELGWSPSRKIHLTVNVNAGQQYLLNSQTPATTVGTIARLEYKPMDNIFVYVENSFGLENLFSADPLSYREIVKLGFDYSY